MWVASIRVSTIFGIISLRGVFVKKVKKTWLFHDYYLIVINLRNVIPTVLRLVPFGYRPDPCRRVCPEPTGRAQGERNRIEYINIFTFVVSTL